MNVQKNWQTVKQESDDCSNYSQLIKNLSFPGQNQKTGEVAIDDNKLLNWSIS